jgi:hypothetical protein
VTICIDLKAIVLNEIHQLQKEKCHLIPLRYLKEVNFIEAENRMVAAREW